MATRRQLPDDGRVTTSEPSPPNSAYFMRNLAAFAEQAGDLPEMAKAVKALTLFNALALAKTDFPFATTYANELAAACMARAAQQLDAAMILTSYGFHTEVRSLLRGVYESVGLGRTLAKDRENSAERATKWIAEGTWWPDKVVRKWLEQTKFVKESEVETYGNTYKNLSAWSHPTRISCMNLFTADNSTLTLNHDPEFDLEATRASVVEIMWTAIFACFAVRNAIANEALIPPAWRRELYGFMEELAGEPIPHGSGGWVWTHFGGLFSYRSWVAMSA